MGFYMKRGFMLINAIYSNKLQVCIFLNFFCCRCWQIDYLAGIVQIKVIKDLNVAIQDEMHIYGVVVVLGIFAWVAIKMFLDKQVTYLNLNI